MEPKCLLKVYFNTIHAYKFVVWHVAVLRGLRFNLAMSKLTGSMLYLEVAELTVNTIIIRLIRTEQTIYLNYPKNKLNREDKINLILINSNK